MWCVPFIIIIILMDTLDGIIARSRGETSLLGSVLDIATDRTLELVLWVVFADMNLIPVCIPLVVIARGTMVDAIRAIGMRQGKAAFEQLKSPISKFLVSSRTMRSTYGVAKAIAFSTLTLNLSLRTANELSSKELKEKAKAVLKHAGRCYYDLYHTSNNPEKILQLYPKSDAIEKIVALSHQEKGVFVVAPHSSNFDLALRALAIYGLKASLLGYANPSSGYKIQNKFRNSMGMEIISLSEENTFLHAVEMLKNGGIVATGIDRPVEVRKKKHMVSFFGHPSALPVGYIQIALAADVPILVLGVKMRSNGTYEIMQSGLIPLKRHPNRFAEIKQNVEMVLEIVAGYIQQAPEQWLMFYPVWPDMLEKLP